MMVTRTLLFVGLWAVTVVAGVCLLDRNYLRASRTGSVTAQWPETSSLQPEPGVATLVMALHPQCQCSALTLSELEGVLARRHMRINVHLLVFEPRGYPVDWTLTALVRQAQSIQGVDVLFDKGGAELNKFHAHASGELWFYDGSGKLRFRGGITGGANRPGRNSGVSTLLSLAGGDSGLVEEAPVFGCTIDGEDRTPSEIQSP